MLRFPTISGIVGGGLFISGAVLPEFIKDLPVVAQAVMLGMGICLLGVPLIWYFLGRAPSPASAGATHVFVGHTEIHHHYLTLDEKLAGEPLGSKPAAPPVPIPAENPVYHRSSITIVEEDDRLEATAVTGLYGLYVGDVIVAVKPVEAENRLDIAIRGYNGTGQAIRLSEVFGNIRAGTGNLRDMISLPTPELQGAPTAESGEEFLIALRQRLSEAMSAEFLQAWETGKHVSLDLRELVIPVASAINPEKTARLPLWDGVNLRRRDDIVSVRNSIMSVGLSSETSTALALGVGTHAPQRDED